MIHLLRTSLLYIFLFMQQRIVSAQDPVDQVNVFLGSSGDHGQMSPAASSPFHQMSIAPQTSPNLHMGYEYYAKQVLGFTHNRLEGVGCQGSGGLILIRPYVGDATVPLKKISDQAGPGFYEINLESGLHASFAVDGQLGIHHYTFPQGKKGLKLMLDHSFNNAFVSNTYSISPEGVVLGTVRSKTTCHVGVYSIHYAIQLPRGTVRHEGQNIDVQLADGTKEADLKIAFSSVDTSAARLTLYRHAQETLQDVKDRSRKNWENQLSRIIVKGDPARTKLFYSLFYRTLQSPYVISEQNGDFRGTDGDKHHATTSRYHGWAIWDNYKTQLPLLSFVFPDRYQDMVTSISDLYRYGKYDFAGPFEPANSVRTEHVAVVLLDALKKGYQLDVQQIRDSLIRDTARFDFSKPDKYLEATYDMWAMSQLIPKEKKLFLERSRSYKDIWNKEFKDLSKRDVDRMSARNMYQGTIRQYRWNVPFDLVGLTKLIGGQDELSRQLDDFFDNHYFNRANEPDIQSPTLYYASTKPWRYQSLVQELALDTVIQYYFNDNSRGIDPFIDRIYKNEPKAFVRTMDDDAGAMSGWFVLTALGLHQPLVGEPIYYLSVPLFPEIQLRNGQQDLQIKVVNFGDNNRYIQRVRLNGKDIQRVWLRHEEIMQGGTLEIEASPEPTTYGQDTMWVSDMGK